MTVTKPSHTPEEIARRMDAWLAAEEVAEADWRAQEYEDNCWAERDAAVEDAASSWDADVLDAVSTAIDALVAGRAAAKAEVRAMLMGQTVE